MAGNHATGMPIAYEKSADARQKRWGKRFQAVLAEIAKPKARGTPSSSLWFFVLLSTRWARLNILKNRSRWLPHFGPIWPRRNGGSSELEPRRRVFEGLLQPREYRYPA